MIKIFKITAMDQLKELWYMLTSDRDEEGFADSYLYDYCTCCSGKRFEHVEAVYKDMLNEDGMFFIDSRDGTYIDQDTWRNNKRSFKVAQINSERYSL